MRKLLIIPALLAVLFGCSKGGSYSLKWKLQDTTLNGKTVYLMNYDNGKDTIDSVVVKDNTISLQGSVETPVPVALTLADGQRLSIFVLEPGKLTIDSVGNVHGTEVNEKTNQMSHATDSIYDAYETKIKLVNNSSTASVDEMVSQVSALNEERDSAIIAYYKSFYEANKDNYAGYFAFMQLAYDMNKADMEKMLAGTPDWFRNTTRVKRCLEAAASREKTSAGKMFTDFTVKTSSGKDVKLSDFVGKGQYVLVDFFASWCGPCMREMPNLKGLYDKYNGKGLQIVGIAVWDQPEDTKRAVEEQQLPWTIVDNAQRIPTDIYGISGIPHLILFAPDGKIVVRGLTGEALSREVDKALSSK